MTPTNLELVDLKHSESGRLTFRSVNDVGDVVYRFDGAATSNGVSGQFQIVREGIERNAESTELPVTLTKLDLASAIGSAASISGLYSNVQYSEEGGDLTGTELLLFHHQGKLTAILTSFENDMVPYVATGIMRSGNSIKFRVRTETGEESYSVLSSRHRMILRRIGANSDLDAARMVLLKRKGLATIFADDDSRRRK